MLETERLYLRAFKIEDAIIMSGYRNKEEVYKYQSWSSYPYDTAKNRIEYCLAHPFEGQIGNYQFAIILKATDLLIGDIFLEVYNKNMVVLGYTLDSSFWFQGYATEILSNFLLYLKNYYGFTTVLSYVYADNQKSIRLLHKLGFQQFERSRSMGDIGYKKIL